jgi:hypothetical protein
MYRVDTPAASLSFDGPGEYRIVVFLDPQTGLVATELAVVHGTARLDGGGESVLLRAGERSTIREAETPTFPQPFNSARFSPFDDWIRDRQGARTASRAAAYLPPEIQVYAGAFDRYGTWGQMPDYGYVWYPTAIGAGWRPYYNGYWSHVGRYGWLWAGADPWAWPTHHFGHWGFHRGSWFWRPGRAWARPRVWWGVSPGYVAWCPIGIDGRPLFGFWGGGLSHGLDPWRGWTVIGRNAFGTRTHVGSVALDFRTVGRDSLAAFVVQRHPPAWRAAIATNAWASRGRAGVVPTVFGGGAWRGTGPIGPVGLGAGSRPAGGTRIASPPIGMAPLYSPPSGSFESPYLRAERIAAGRRGSDARAREAGPRTPSPSRYSPAPSLLPSPYASPYPPQFQVTPPRPSPTPQSRMIQPFSTGSPGQPSRTGGLGSTALPFRPGFGTPAPTPAPGVGPATPLRGSWTGAALGMGPTAIPRGRP